MENKLIELIKHKSLAYLKFDKLVSNLAYLTNRSKDEIQDEVKLMIENGDLMYDENQRLFSTSSRGYIKCKIVANKKGYAFAEIINNEENKADIFIPKDALNGAIDEDIVLVQITYSEKENSEGKVVSILRRVNEYVVGELTIIGGKYYLEPDNEKFPIIRINSGDKLKSNKGDKVVAKIIFDGDKGFFRGVITECLGKAGNVSTEERAIIREYKIRDKFPEEVIKESKIIEEEVSENEKKNREDFTGLKIITIDGEDSRDFDDAISVEKLESGGYIVGVHIADVSHYVQSGTALDDEAFLRGNSVYFPDLVIPMLPEKLSNGICSLREGVERLTLSVIIELDKNCKVLKSRISNSVIKSVHRMTYTKIQEMLNGNQTVIDEYKDIYEDVLAYAEISKKLQLLRKERGEIRLDLPEPKVYENSDGTINRIEKEIQDESHQLIESLMILANEVVAQTFFAKKLPFVYRIHEKPETDKVVKLTNVLAGLGINARFDVENATYYDYQKLVEQIENDPRKDTLMKIILRSMMKACYSEKCLGHFGIASSFYCHFTSPIRRYPDLMIHRIIKHYLNGEKSKNLHIEFDEVVKKVAEQSSLTERQADDVERAVDDYKKALYMKNHLGETYPAIISGVYDFGVFVELDNTIEGMIRFEYLPVDSYDYDEKSQILKGEKHSFRLGDKIDVVCVNVEIKSRKIDFDLAEKLNKASIEEIMQQRNFNKTRVRQKTKETKNKSKEKTTKANKIVKVKKPKTKNKSRKKKYSRKNIKIEY